MSLFHKHKWVELERFYALPTNRGMAEMSEFLIERMLFGLTTCLFGCQICGKMKTVEILGQSLKEGVK